MDGVEHLFGATHHKARRFQELIPACVVRQILSMLTAVEFDHNQWSEAREVANVEANLVLPPELEASELATTQPAP